VVTPYQSRYHVHQALSQCVSLHSTITVHTLTSTLCFYCISLLQIQPEPELDLDRTSFGGHRTISLMKLMSTTMPSADIKGQLQFSASFVTSLFVVFDKTEWQWILYFYRRSNIK